MPADGTRDHEEFATGPVEQTLTQAQTLKLLMLVDQLAAGCVALKNRVDALEARMEHVVTAAETSEERLRRVYGERY